MTEEKIFEIIKAIAYGLDEDTIAECNEVTTSEVKEIMLKYKNEVSNKKNEIMEVYGDVF